MIYQQFLQRGTYYLRRVGVAGWTGLVAFVAAIGYGALVVVPAITRLDQDNETIGRLHQDREKPLADQKVDSPAQQLSDFYRRFGGEGTIPDELQRVFELAAEQRLDLDIGEYAMVQSQEGLLDQYRIVFPVRASYPDIRKFIGRSLAAVSSLSLDGITLRRERVSDGELDARITFVLFKRRIS